MDIVTGSGEVFLESQEHIDAHTLVGLHHIVEHIVGRVEEKHRADTEQRDVEEAADAGGKPLIDEENRHGDDGGKLYPHDVEGYDEAGCEGGYEGGGSHGYGHDAHGLGRLAVGGDHAGSENLRQQQDDILAHRGGGVHEHHVLVLDADDKIDDHRHTRKEDAALHAFAVEHQEKREVNQRRASLLLPDDEEHR